MILEEFKVNGNWAEGVIRIPTAKIQRTIVLANNSMLKLRTGGANWFLRKPSEENPYREGNYMVYFFGFLCFWAIYLFGIFAPKSKNVSR